MSSKITTERRRLKAHENLIIQVIKRQAGTLSKAALEGVMNSIDAIDQMSRRGNPVKDPAIAVTITSTLLKIVDNGMGFESADSIKEVFEIFGNPHELDENGISKDATFGTFRIGRGQLFAFGKNTWRSNEFQMEADIDNWELDYDLKTGMKRQPGCSIKVELYEALSQAEIQSTIDEITKFCRYVPHKLTVNGADITDDPAKRRWDVTTEDAYISKKVVESRWRYGSGLDVYQQGVFVETIAASEFGLEGTIVIRKPVQVNFARNQVIRRCPQWKKITKLLKREGVEEAKRKSRLTLHEARSFVQKFSSGDEVDFNDFWETACLPDVNGKMWSCEQLRRLSNSNAASPRIMRSPLGAIRVAFAERGDRAGDRVMQLRKAVVLDNNIIHQLKVDVVKKTRRAQEDEVLEILRGASPLCNISKSAYAGRYDRFHGKLAWASVSELLDDAKTSYELLDQDSLRPREKDFVRCCWGIMWRMRNKIENNCRNNKERKLVIGISDMADGWTDGSSYIAINRKFIEGLNLGLERDWHKAANLLLHEMCHREPDTTTHNHTPEFYEDYQDGTNWTPDEARHCYQTYRKVLQHRMKKAPKALQNQLHIEAETFVLDQLAYEPFVKPEGATKP